MPSYLKGLWSACQSTGDGQKKWIQDENFALAGYPWNERLAEYDCVVFAAGAGLFQSSMLDTDIFEKKTQLVRGQSIEMTVDNEDHLVVENALLCGKYVSPLPENNRVLIGATHEYKREPLTRDEVEAELRDRSHAFASAIWTKGSIDQITSGYRVQSNRGKHGRLPIIGSFESRYHSNSWIFTGLSSRGLLYHGVFGDMLSDMIIGRMKENDFADIDWWKKG